MVNVKKYKKNYCLFKQLNSCFDICLIYYLYNDNYIFGKKRCILSCNLVVLLNVFFGMLIFVFGLVVGLIMILFFEIVNVFFLKMLVIVNCVGFLVFIFIVDVIFVVCL